MLVVSVCLMLLFWGMCSMLIDRFGRLGVMIGGVLLLLMISMCMGVFL